MTTDARQSSSEAVAKHCTLQEAMRSVTLFLASQKAKQANTVTYKLNEWFPVSVGPSGRECVTIHDKLVMQCTTSFASQQIAKTTARQVARNLLGVQYQVHVKCSSRLTSTLF